MKKAKSPPILENLTIHGLKKISSKKRSHTLWRVIMFVNLIVTVILLIVIRNGYQYQRIITRINPNCKINQVPFPAVSICNYNLVSNKRSQNIQSILKSSNVSGSDIELFLQSLPNLVDFRNSNVHTSDYDHVLSVLKKHYFNIETIMEEVHQRCEDLLLYCSFNRKPTICTNMFRLVKTFEGHCCTFNYVALNDDSIENVLPDEDHEHYEDTESDQKHSEIIVTAESGRGSGLLVVFNVEPSDYPPWALTPSYGAKVLINDPNDYPEYSVIYKRVNTEISLDIKVQPHVFDADDSLRRIPNTYRGCAFHDEIELKHTDRYSSETCTTECKMRSYLKYCGCVPYKYPQETTTRICEFKDLECLNNFRAKKLSGERCDPLCYLECRDKQYRVTNDIMPLVADLYPDDVMNNRNTSELTALQVYFDRPTCNCYKQMLLMDFTSLIGICLHTTAICSHGHDAISADYNVFVFGNLRCIATYGGIFSLSFGASLHTLFEVVFLTLNAIVYYSRKSVSVLSNNKF